MNLTGESYQPKKYTFKKYSMNLSRYFTTYISIISIIIISCFHSIGSLANHDLQLAQNCKKLYKKELEDLKGPVDEREDDFVNAINSFDISDDNIDWPELQKILSFRKDELAGIDTIGSFVGDFLQRDDLEKRKNYLQEKLNELKSSADGFCCLTGVLGFSTILSLLTTILI